MTETDPQTDLDALVRRHQAGVWRFARALGAQPAEADDLTQEAFVAAHRRAAEVPAGPGAAGWLRPGHTSSCWPAAPTNSSPSSPNSGPQLR